MNSGHQHPPIGASTSATSGPAAEAACTFVTKLPSITPNVADASAISTEMMMTAPGDAPRSIPNASIPTAHITPSCATPRNNVPANFPTITDSRRVPFDTSRSSVCDCRSRAIASALNAAVKNRNIVRYAGRVKFDGWNGSMSPTRSTSNPISGAKSSCSTVGS